MQKIKRTKKQQLRNFLPWTRRSNVWVFLAPLVTFVGCVGAWLALALNEAVRTSVSRGISAMPMPLSSTEVLLVTTPLLLVCASLYFWIDYQQHRRLLRREDPAFAYSAMHHARKVVVPKLHYNWKQAFGWLAYGVGSIVVVAGVLATQIKPVAASAVPAVRTLTPVSVGQTSATFKGTTSPKGISQRGFEYGLTTDYGQQIVDGSGLTDYQEVVGWLCHNTNNDNCGGHPYVRSMAVSNEGYIYVMNQSGPYIIQKFDLSGNYIMEWDTDIPQASDIAVDSSGNVYVGGNQYYEVIKFSSTGDVLDQWNTSGESVKPGSITIDQDDNIYIADWGYYSNGRIQKYTATGSFITQWSGSYNGSPIEYRVAVDSEGNIYRTNSGSSYVTKFDPSGNQLAQWSASMSIIQLHIDSSDNVYISGSSGVTKKFTKEGALLAEISGNSEAIATDSHDNLFLARRLVWYRTTVSKLAPSISSALENLSCGTTYHYRAFATNAEGTGYGDNQTFTTEACPVSDFTNAFITTWKTDNPGTGANNQIVIPSSEGWATNYTVDWGDGNTTSGHTGSATHTYASPGTYTIAISGDFPSIHGVGGKLLSVDQWGANLWQSMDSAFAGASNLQIPATDAPNLSNVTNMSLMFSGATSFNSNINDWDVSNVVYMDGMFQNATSFNQPLNNWDTSNVTDMGGMFAGASSFNQNINSWNTGNVTKMSGMFRNNLVFNQPIDNWDTSSITTMRDMFANEWDDHPSAFNQPLNSWDTGNVTDMEDMFYNASSFNQPLNSWDVSNVTDMSFMFAKAIVFNQPLNSWDTSNVTAVNNMFYHASAFNGSIDNWNVSNVTSLSQMFLGAVAFNQNVNSWDVSNVTNMTDLFGGATAFNQPLSDWDVSSVTDMDGMFSGATSFNQPLSDWDVSSVVDMRTMFVMALAFDQSLAGWNVSNVTNMDLMFGNYDKYLEMIFGDTPYEDWPDEYKSLYGSPSSQLSPAHYDATLTSWSAQDLQSDVLFDAGTSTYCAAAADRQAIIDDFNWTINDAGEDCTPQVDFTNAFITTWDTRNTSDGSSASNQINIPTYYSFGGETYDYSVDWGDGNVQTGITDSVTHTYASAGTYTVKIAGTFPRIFFNNSRDRQKILTVEQWGSNQWTSMNSAFFGASNLTVPATDVPDLSNLTDVGGMFAGATTFNQNINSWDVSNVQNMAGMFDGATSFNQPLNNWNTSSVIYMHSMFADATSFNQNINTWDVSNVTGISAMFRNATSFNQPLDNWDTSSVTYMYAMFAGASSFDQSLASWGVSNVTNMDMMFLGEPMGQFSSFSSSGLSTANYDATLASWSQQDLQDGVTFDAGTSTYCNAEVQRQSMIDTFSWTINDSGKDCDNNFKQSHTLRPNKLSGSKARFKGSVSGPGAGNFVSGGFEWGTSPSFGSSVDNLTITNNEFSRQVNLSCGIQYYYRAFGVDGSNVRTYGDTRTFSLDCPETATNRSPVVLITSPKNNQVFEKNKEIVLSAEASDPDGSIKEVRFYLNGKQIGVSYKAPYTLVVQSSELGNYRFVAVAEDNDGAVTVATPVNFTVFISQPLAPGATTTTPSNQNKPGSGLDIAKDVKEPVIFGGTSYKPKSLLVQVARSLPWMLLQLLAVVYLLLAYRQARQNNLLKKTLKLTNQTRENIENFLSIITHYLGTSVTVISLAADAVPSQSPQRAATERFKPIAAKLKEYANELISRLNNQAAPIKQGLERGGLVTRPSIYRWVLIPSVAALALMLVSYAGLFGLWAGETGRAVLSAALVIGGMVATLVFFEVWQRQRQLKIDLALTTNNAEKALRVRRDFIVDTQQSLARQVEYIREQGSLVSDPAFQKHFAGGLTQLSQVSDGFTSILQLTAAVSAGTVRAYLPIKQVIHTLEVQANEKHQKLVLDEPASITTKLLPKELEHILTTLVQNSIQFSPEGGKIKVRARGNKHFEVKVTDEGAGIAKDQQAQLMQPFSRGTSTKTYDHEGLGLNLYLTRLIAEKYNGSVDIQSAKGKGTTVTVTVP